jgi:hypothetical protein
MSDEKLLLDKSFYMRESKTVEIATWFSSGYTTALMDSFIDATASERLVRVCRNAFAIFINSQINQEGVQFNAKARP